MKKMSKDEQLNVNGGWKLYMYIIYCGGCGVPCVGYSETMCEAEHGFHLSSKFGKKNCYGKGRSRTLKVLLYDSKK